MVNNQNQFSDGVTYAPADLWIGAARLLLGAMLGLILLAGPALAQGTDFVGFLEAGLAVQGKGWAQLLNTEEMLRFVLGVVETTVMTATIAYHPASLAARRTAADYQMPRTLFAYSLIGMVVGFLVVNHGYVIGFVIFGLGGLLRFRNETESSTVVAKYILVTLLGLCVGINLPVMALIITVSAWVILYFLRRGAFVTLEVRFTDDQPIDQSMEALLEALGKRNFKTVTMTKTKFKPVVGFIFSGGSKTMRESLMREMIVMESATPRTVIDWHLN